MNQLRTIGSFLFFLSIPLLFSFGLLLGVPFLVIELGRAFARHLRKVFGLWWH